MLSYVVATTRRINDDGKMEHFHLPENIEHPCIQIWDRTQVFISFSRGYYWLPVLVILDLDIKIA